MSNCRDEAKDDDHDHHGHGHHGHKHNSIDKDDKMYGTSLYKYIERNNIKCLNESVNKAGQSVFKPLDNMLDNIKYVESDVGPELLFTVYFSSEVSLMSIIIGMEDKDSMPTSLILWNDPKDSIHDWDDAETKLKKKDQKIDLSYDPKCEIHYKVKQRKFQSLLVLKMLFRRDDADDDDEIRINYIGLKGKYKGPKSRRAVKCLYESAANPNDHANITKSTYGNINKTTGN
mmetsp:Transcript_19737/g.24337  ORF Transcript_19737/g.24337 Transcript_19737/m.24337 type:complete len:231 (-) Transcript_19737:199-891(-)